MTVPTHHKAALYSSPGNIAVELEDVPTPTPGLGEVLVRLSHTGVCHSDLAVMTNSWAFLPFPIQPGQIGGHEGVGKIISVGPGIEVGGPKVGDRVGVKWIAQTCGGCVHCISGDDVSCEGLKISGYYTPGTFQEYVIAKANYVTPVPDGLASEVAAPLLCGGVTVYSALKKTGARPGDYVVIPGCSGGLGHLGLQLGSRVFGFRMIGIDSGDKRSIAEECGCELFFDISQYKRDKAGSDKLAEDIKAATSDGKGATAVVVCTGSKAAYDQAVSLLRVKGTLVCVGVPSNDVTPIVGAEPGTLVAKQVKIVGSAVGNRLEAIETLEYAARGLIKTKVTVESLKSLGDVFQKMQKGQLHGRAVIDLSK